MSVRGSGHTWQHWWCDETITDSWASSSLLLSRPSSWHSDKACQLTSLWLSVRFILAMTARTAVHRLHMLSLSSWTFQSKTSFDFFRLWLVFAFSLQEYLFGISNPRSCKYLCFSSEHSHFPSFSVVVCFIHDIVKKGSGNLTLNNVVLLKSGIFI